MIHEPAAEFSRPIRLDAIGTEAAAHIIAANPAERAALAARFGLENIGRLEAELRLVHTPPDHIAQGHLTARVTQVCVATGDLLPVTLNVPFLIRFTSPDASAGDDGVELSAEDGDVMNHDGQQIDIGEAVAQTLLLALDPFPRSPNADTHLKAAGVVSEADVRPFSALQTLKERLTKS